MGEAAVSLRLSVADYLELERSAEVRHEYRRGERSAMAGGTRNHARLGLNFGAALSAHEARCGCTAFNGDLRIRIEAEDCFLYPEAAVVCGPEQYSPLDPDALVNPVLIAEVLSESTEAYDRGEKFRLYRTLASLRDYVLISQKQPLVEVFSRDESGLWQFRAYEGLETAISLPTMDAEIAMRDLYRGVVWA
ncbi:MAG: Uma2 family endonuclease [Bacteroidia bacterium]|nr:Uma2 family endonuclease [Bacteroidia bacterium]